MGRAAPSRPPRHLYCLHVCCNESVLTSIEKGATVVASSEIVAAPKAAAKIALPELEVTTPVATDSPNPSVVKVATTGGGTVAAVRKRGYNADGTKRAALTVKVAGKVATNRHFMLDAKLFNKVDLKSARSGLTCTDVLRLGLAEYAAGAAEAAASGAKHEVLDKLPPESLNDLKALYDAGDIALVDSYLAALHEAGWPLRLLGLSLSAIGVKGKSRTNPDAPLTRQAVSLRVLNAAVAPPETLPAVPSLPLRRYSSRTVARDPQTVRDFALRLPDEEYRLAMMRAKAEGALMASVAEDIMRRYLEGSFVVEPFKHVRVRTA